FGFLEVSGPWVVVGWVGFIGGVTTFERRLFAGVTIIRPTPSDRGGRGESGGGAKTPSPKRRFDVPRAQPAREHLHRQALELHRAARPGRPARGRQTARRDRRPAGPHTRWTPPHFGEPAAPIAIAVAGAGRRPVLVVATAHGVGDLRFQGFLHDLTYRELEELGTSIAVSDALAQQLIKLLARPLRCRYSRRHGDASSC